MVDQEAMAALPWYHVFEFSDGVTTDGYYDLRRVVDRILPSDLTGKRCLDAATASGFYAFEMERRGAAEAVAIDLDQIADRDYQFPWTAVPQRNATADSFAFAKQSLGFGATRVGCSLYDADPDRLGTFDFVFVGSVLLHLRDPVRALRALRSVTAGTLRSYEVQLLWESLRHPRLPVAHLAKQEDSRWWTPNRAAHRRWMVAAGFEITGSSGWTYAWRRNRIGEHLVGVPSGWFEGRPAV